MGKKILVQRRGRGTPVFQAEKKHKIAKARIPGPEKIQGTTFTLVDLLHERGRTAPLAKFQFEDTRLLMYLPAVEGLSVGESYEIGNDAPIKAGNILPLNALPEATPVCNIELQPGDGGAFVRASGGTATVVSRSKKHVTVKLSSGQLKELHPNCRAVVGAVSGGGRLEKPFLKAGKKFAFKKAKGQLGAWPRVSGVAMNHHVHPYGGGAHKSPHKPTTVSRDAPPGRKIGLIAARRTGLKRGKASK